MRLTPDGSSICDDGHKPPQRRPGRTDGAEAPAVRTLGCTFTVVCSSVCISTVQLVRGRCLSREAVACARLVCLGPNSGVSFVSNWLQRSRQQSVRSLASSRSRSRVPPSHAKGPILANLAHSDRATTSVCCRHHLVTLSHTTCVNCSGTAVSCSHQILIAIRQVVS